MPIYSLYMKFDMPSDTLLMPQRESHKHAFALCSPSISIESSLKEVVHDFILASYCEHL